MRNGLFAICLLALALLAPAAMAAEGAADSDFGLGFMLGNPTGLTGKYWIADPHSLTFDAAFQWWSPGPRLDVNYEYNFEDFLKEVEDSPCTLRLSFGGGAGLGWTRLYSMYPHLDNPPGHDRSDREDWEDDYFMVVFVRAPLSLSARFREYPLEPFFMIAPLIGLTPDAYIGWDSALGVRYYF